MTCEHYDSLLEKWLIDDISDDELADMTVHEKNCPDCMQKKESLASLDVSLQSLRDATPNPSPSFHASWVSAISASKKKIPLWKKMLPAAAALVLVSGAIILQQSRISDGAEDRTAKYSLNVTESTGALLFSMDDRVAEEAEGSFADNGPHLINFSYHEAKTAIESICAQNPNAIAVYDLAAHTITLSAPVTEVDQVNLEIVRAFDLDSSEILPDWSYDSEDTCTIILSFE